MKQITLTADETIGGMQFACAYNETAGAYGTVQVNDSLVASHTPATADANDVFTIENGALKVTTSTTNGTDYALVNGVLSVNNGFSGTITSTATFNNEVQTKEIDFIYDHNGMRTGKIVSENGRVEITEYTLHGKLITHMTKRIVEANGREYSVDLHFYYDSLSRPAFVEYCGIKYQYIYNLQGDVVGAVDASGKLVLEYGYDAWGNLIYGTEDLRILLGVYNPFQYRAYVYDSESRHYFLRNRYYSSTHGRFINTDKLVGELSVLMTCNTFMYCKNNPQNRLDVDGMKSKSANSTMPIAYDFPILPVVHDIPRNPTANKARVNKHAVDQLMTNTSTAQKKVQEIGKTSSGIVDRVGKALIWFKNQVDHGAVWDYKQPDRTPEWLEAHGVDKVTIEGIDMNMEEYGNFHYGFVGYAMGIPRAALMGGSVYAHYTSHGNLNEDPHDLEMIDAGIAMAARYIEKGLI